MSKFKVISKNSTGKTWSNSHGQLYRVILSAMILLSLALAGAAISAEPVGPGLSAKLRGLLIKEMIEIESAMHVTYSAIVQGNHATVAKQGQAIHASFILAQSLTEQDRKDLIASVPGEFLQIDERLHQLAAALAEAGKQENTQEQVKVFSQMTESCVACHSRYMTDRFDGLQNQLLPETWGHGEDHDSVSKSHHQGGL